MKKLNEIKKWEDMIGNVVNCDCLEGMKLIPDKSIDMILTSPPYDNLRDYTGGDNFFFCYTALEITRILKDGGVCVWIVSDSVVNGSESMASFKQAIYFNEICGLNLHDTMIYQKNAMPFPDQSRYIHAFEYMFVFSKGKPKTINLIKEKTKGYKPSISNTQRNKDGSVTKLKYETGKEERSRWNVWIYEVGFMKSAKQKYVFEHPAIFPEKLAQDHTVTWSNANDLVLDPFAGSGTTLRACKDLNRRFIGMEIGKKYCEICDKRLAQEVMQF